MVEQGISWIVKESPQPDNPCLADEVRESLCFGLAWAKML
jgi:hypothetical protein